MNKNFCIGNIKSNHCRYNIIAEDIDAEFAKQALGDKPYAKFKTKVNYVKFEDLRVYNDIINVSNTIRTNKEIENNIYIEIYKDSVIKIIVNGKGYGYIYNTKFDYANILEVKTNTVDLNEIDYANSVDYIDKAQLLRYFNKYASKKYEHNIELTPEFEDYCDLEIRFSKAGIRNKTYKMDIFEFCKILKDKSQDYINNIGIESTKAKFFKDKIFCSEFNRLPRNLEEFIKVSECAIKMSDTEEYINTRNEIYSDYCILCAYLESGYFNQLKFTIKHLFSNEKIDDAYDLYILSKNIIENKWYNRFDKEYIQIACKVSAESCIKTYECSYNEINEMFDRYDVSNVIAFKEMDNSGYDKLDDRLKYVLENELLFMEEFYRKKSLVLNSYTQIETLVKYIEDNLDKINKARNGMKLQVNIYNPCKFIEIEHSYIEEVIDFYGEVFKYFKDSKIIKCGDKRITDNDYRIFLSSSLDKNIGIKDEIDEADSFKDIIEFVMGSKFDEVYGTINCPDNTMDKAQFRLYHLVTGDIIGKINRCTVDLKGLRGKEVIYRGDNNKKFKFLVQREGTGKRKQIYIERRVVYD